jgi:DNA-binding transcriptional ArsR family regulator
MTMLRDPLNVPVAEGLRPLPEREAGSPGDHQDCGPLFEPDDDRTQAVARFFRVLGDPTRLRILRLLLEGDRNVSELVRAIDAPQSRISNHLSCLRWCQLVTAKRSGREVIYSLADWRVAPIIELVGSSMTEDQVAQLTMCNRLGSQPTPV